MIQVISISIHFEPPYLYHNKKENFNSYEVRGEKSLTFSKKRSKIYF